MKGEIFYIIICSFVLHACGPKTPEHSSIPDEIRQKAEHLKTDVLQNSLFNNDTVGFLLENMKYHYSVNSKKEGVITDIIKDTSLAKYTKKNKIKEILGKYSLSSSKMLYDVETINAQWIQNYIESLKNYKKSSWGGQVPFEIFANYLLPYRIENERVTDWKNYLSKDFFNVHDSSFYRLEFIEAVKKVHDWLYDRNTGFELDITPIPNLPLEINDKLQFGSCFELAKKAVALLRALSIPAAIDYVPNFLNYNGGHAWCTAMLDENNSYSLDITSASYKNDNFKISKVYRRNFAPVNNNHFHERGHCSFLPDWLNDPFLMDVTSNFTETSDIKIKLKAASNTSYAYLSIFRRNVLVPIAFGNIDNGYAIFKSIARDGVYVVQSIESNKTINLTQPFIVDTDGNIQILTPQMKETIRAKLYRKYPAFESKTFFRERMEGGKFQGSNDSLFEKADDLYVIDEIPGDFKYRIVCKGNKKYKYLRYYSGMNSFGNVAEVEFYNEKNELLKGKIIGTEGSWDNNPKRTKHAAFDNDPLTFFDADLADHSWTGIQLSEPEFVKEIRFLPRSDQNGIIDGQLYELFYWNDGWKSLGKQTGKSRPDNTMPYLRCSNVPSNALLYLRNLTHGVEERIFIYKDGNQIWY